MKIRGRNEGEWSRPVVVGICSIKTGGGGCEGSVEGIRCGKAETFTFYMGFGTFVNGRSKVTGTADAAALGNRKRESKGGWNSE